jgi:hypothetical protein
MWHKRIFQALALLIAGASFLALGLAAQDAPSVAEAARRARQKKEAATKPATVITDDTLHPKPATPAAEAAQAAPGNAAAEGAASESTPKKPEAESKEDAEKKKAEIEALRQQIAQKKDGINLLQREIALEQDNFFRNPDYAHDTAGKAKLDSMQTDLQQQKSELADLPSKFAALGGTEEANPPAAPAQAPAQPQP